MVETSGNATVDALLSFRDSLGRVRNEQRLRLLFPDRNQSQIAELAKLFSFENSKTFQFPTKTEFNGEPGVFSKDHTQVRYYHSLSSDDWEQKGGPILIEFEDGNVWYCPNARLEEKSTIFKLEPGDIEKIKKQLTPLL
ncbi:MAG: hypothetical protein WCW16_00335 [Candidatus Magasanikbacteria bacterium]